MALTLVKNGTLIDGTGSPGFNGSLLIEDSTIKQIFKEGEATPEIDNLIDAEGLVIAPGFIDMHSHADWMLPWNRHHQVLNCLVEQGITTVVGGNCGISPAPMIKEASEKTEILAAITMPESFDYHWQSMEEYLSYIEKNGSIVNLAELAGHATLRYNTNQSHRGDLSSTDLKHCLENTRKSLDEGACGLSFGLGYDPGMYSTLDELAAFCKVAAQIDKPVTMHMKAFSKISPCYPLTSLKAHNIIALKEAISLVEKTGVRLQLSHFIFVGRKSWSSVDQCLQLVDDARARGLDIMIDAFPYTNGNTTILAPFPYWFLAKIPDAYSNNFLKARLKLELTLGFKLVGFSYPDFQVMDTSIPEFESLNGLTISQIAKRWNLSSFQTMLTLAEKSKGGCLMLFHTYSGDAHNQKPLEKVLMKDYCLFETDAAIKGTGFPNPASIGTFPRVLGHYVRDRKLMTLEQAIHRMTGASAKRFKITDTGTLEVGKGADVVCFDPNSIADSYQDFSKPASKPKGIHHVLINGKQVVRKGCYSNDIKAGRVIRT